MSTPPRIERREAPGGLGAYSREPREPRFNADGTRVEDEREPDQRRGVYVWRSQGLGRSPLPTDRVIDAA